MKAAWGTTGIALATAGMAMWLSSGTAAGQDTRPAAAAAWDPPRTPDGQPDIRGQWRAVPGGTHDITAVVTGEGIFRDLLAQQEGRPIAPRPSRVIDPPDGRIPYQPWAAQKQREIQQSADHPTERRHIDPYNRCLPGGVPRDAFPVPFRFYQTPGYVIFLGTQRNPSRVIPLDGRPHIADTIKLWMGSSRGRWEGNTLVIDVRNQNGKGRLDMVGNFATDAVRVIERWTLVDPTTLEYTATIEDPGAYTRPWTIAARFEKQRERPDAEPYDREFWTDYCHEGERSAEQMLLAPAQR